MIARGRDAAVRTPVLKAVYACLFSIAIVTAVRMPAYGSTLWAAAGSHVQGGGTLMAQNYDDKPISVEPRLVIPKRGFTYLGLFSLKGPKGQGPLAGVNEKGLAVAAAVPETLPPDPNPRPSVEQTTEKLLAGFETVEGILSDRKILGQGPPAFYLIADRQRIASVEIAPRGAIAVKSLEAGLLCHTNHYTDEKLLTWNKKVAGGSEARLERIRQLLGGIGAPLDLDRFVEIGRDRGTNQEEAVLRTAPSSGAVRTLAAWVLFIPDSNVPELRIGLFGSDGTEKEYDLKLDRPFWTEGLR